MSPPIAAAIPTAVGHPSAAMKIEPLALSFDPSDGDAIGDPASHRCEGRDTRHRSTERRGARYRKS